MNLTDIAHIRLLSQQIAQTQFKNAKEMVGWMGAMQAQDYAMAKWAVGVRLPDTTDHEIETALNNGDIIRTHLLRPTWHLASADDIHWLLELTAPQIKASLKSRHKELELTELIFTKSNALLEKALTGGQHRTREELVAEFSKAHIATDENRAAHLFLRAELDGLVCSGAAKAGKQTYALLEERVPRTNAVTREEALARLAKTYFTSHCPATLADFVWWSGLAVGDARRALEMIKADFVSEIIDSQTYWFPQSFAVPKMHEESVYLLPAFDEFIISYKDRRASLPYESHNKAVSNNGVFRPMIVVNGQVIGIWRRAVKKDKVIVGTEFFAQPNKATKDMIKEATIQFGAFLVKKTELVWNQAL